MKYILTIALLSLTLSSYAEEQQNSDTTAWLREHLYDGSYHIVFVDKRSNSPYRKQMAVRPINKADVDSQMKTIKDNFGVVARTYDLQPYTGVWYPLYPYKGKYYLYYPSDAGENPWAKISSSTITLNYFDPGPTTSIITKAVVSKQTADFEIVNTVNGKISLKIYTIDPARGIAVFDCPYWGEENRYTLMVAASKSMSFPIVVNYCRESRTDEWKFDTPNFAKLLKK